MADLSPVPPPPPPVVNRKIQVKLRGGQVLGMVRQQYLRRDIPCGAELCFEDETVCRNSSLPLRHKLPKDVTHYILPLSDVISDFLEILEFQELTGIIFLQSAVNVSSNLKYCRRIHKMIHDPKKCSIFYPDEFSEFTHLDRSPDFSNIEIYRAEQAFKTANWYYDHLGGQKPIVILSERDDIIARLKNKRLEVFVLNLGDYLRDFWPTSDTASEVYLGLKEKQLLLGNTNGNENFEDYMKTEALDSLLKSGKVIEGKLRVNKYHSLHEAFITHPKTQEEILIPGNCYRNRAIDGDIVAVQLLPKSEWRNKTNRLEDISKDSDEISWSRGADVNPCGKVVGILQRNWREYVAFTSSTPSYNDGYETTTDTNTKIKRILTVPYDRRIPKIRVLTSQNLNNDRFVVRIDNWPINSQYPNGHFVRSLGPVGDLETEIDCLLLENCIEVTPFSRGILNEMPSEDEDGQEWTVNNDDTSRKDLRNSHFVFSVDPEGCQDVDDALSIRTLSNGNLELGVHIADVTYFVKQGSLTDKEAAKRATTVYLADRRYDMLPPILSGNVCSLLSGRDRYAVSVLWELDPEIPSKVISVWYGRTIIRSSYKLTYEAAQDVIDGVKSIDDIQASITELILCKKGLLLHKRISKLKENLCQLTRVADIIRINRENEGALTLESDSEVRFEFDQVHLLQDLKPKDHLRIHETIAECMIFANHWVAKKISKIFPDRSLLRRHPPPLRDNFGELLKSAESKGWRIETYSNKALADSLNSCNDPKDPIVNTLLRSMATYAMVQAVYFSTGSLKQEEWSHYGLALTHYTHFTSPIRRYADIIVHRLLLKALQSQDWWSVNDDDDGNGEGNGNGKGNGNGETSVPKSNSELTSLCRHINDRNRAAQNAQRASSRLFQTLYFRDKDPSTDPRCIVDGVIYSIKPNGFIVYVPRYALKGPVYVQNTDENKVLCWNEDESVMSWKTGTVWMDEKETRLYVETLEGQRTFRLFDHVTLSIQLKEASSSDAHDRCLFYNLVSPYPQSKKKKEKKEEEETTEIDFYKELQKSRPPRRVEERRQSPPSRKQSHMMYDFFRTMKRNSVSI